MSLQVDSSRKRNKRRAKPNRVQQARMVESPKNVRSLRVLVFYAADQAYTGAVRDFLESFDRYSLNFFFYSPGTHDARLLYDLSLFDAIVMHYSVRLCYDWHISPEVAKAISESDVYKVVFIQDEYDNTGQARKWFRDLGVNMVYTVVPEPYLRDVYPEEETPGIEFVHTLTGWVPARLENWERNVPIEAREDWIHYRGRNLPPWYGDLGREKQMIGERIREECERRGVPCDIEWIEEKRIYGEEWPRFIQGARATLGTESGSNVFDNDGSIRKLVEARLRSDPGVDYETLHLEYMGVAEGRVRMNQISPRIFEAAALGTGMVLFRGEYSGVVRPNEHYIPLEKDFSNVDEVFDRLADTKRLQEMVTETRCDIIESGRYSYRRFIKDFDRRLEEAVGSRSVESSPFAIFEAHQRLIGAVAEEAVEGTMKQLATLSSMNRLLKARTEQARAPQSVKAARKRINQLSWELRQMFLGRPVVASKALFLEFCAVPVRVLQRMGIRPRLWLRERRERKALESSLHN